VTILARYITLTFFIFFSLNADIIRITEKRLDYEVLKKMYEGAKVYRQKIHIFPHRIKTLEKPETLRILAIRVEFEKDDDPFTTGEGLMDLKGFGHPGDGLYYDPPHTKTYFERQLQGLRNYYLLNSKKKLIIEYDVYPKDEFKCYKLPHKMSFYGTPSDYERGLVYLARDALWEADKDTLIDFSNYDAFIIFHAGTNLQTSYFWGRYHDIPSATVTEGAFLYYLGREYIEVDGGIKIGHVSILPESPRVDGMMVGLAGVLYHEIGHQLPVQRSPIPGHIYGLFDLYDVSGWSSGIGAWGLMGGGGWLGEPSGQVPCMLSAYHRYLLGWEEPVEVTQDTTIYLYTIAVDTLSLDTIGDSLHPTSIKIPIREGEYFLIENRQVNTKHDIQDIKDDTVEIDVEYGVPIYILGGEYDAYLPGSGIMVWHVDEDVIEEYGPYNAINIFPEHKGVDVEEADGIQDFDAWSYTSRLEYQLDGSPYDPFFKGGNNLFASYTNPNSNGYYGETGIEILVEDTAKNVMKIRIKKGRRVKGFPKHLNGEVKGIEGEDINQDGKKEIIAVTGSGRIYIWSLSGEALFNTPKNIGDSVNTFFSLGDFDGDGRKEIAVGGISGRIYVFKADSEITLLEGFPINTEGRIYGTLMMHDIDQDGKDEIFVATDKGYIYCLNYKEEPKKRSLGISFTKGPFLIPPGKIGVLGEEGSLFILDKELNLLNGFPKTLGIGNAPLTTTPVVADMDGDGEKEIVAFIPEEENYIFYVLSLDGEVKKKGNIEVQNTGDISVADVDRDGLPEIIFTNLNRLYAFDYGGSISQGFPFRFPDYYTVREVVELSFGDAIVEYSLPFEFTSNVVVGDEDGDGKEEIMLGSPDKGIYVIKSNQKIDTIMARYGIKSVSLGDVDEDGKLELLAGDKEGYVYVWELEGRISSWPTLYGATSRTGYWGKESKRVRKVESLCEGVYIYPNPVDKDRANIHALIGKDAEKISFGIMDVAGDFLYRDIKLENFTKGEPNDFPIDAYLQGLAPGLYILYFVVEGKGGKEVKLYKFCVVR